ncbi:hypothetical protein DES39_1889 [Orbus hercynius]|uniref:Uncharacterized protein n=1 Tax=Orbus hercynius TaxID=593135 RepID=A0A495RB16_9GAMM|nr:hypothetical protein [Orbus hercynius]RKS84677.1 hypothetical protein DES39_1889 [Orbus hercynius]
MKSNPLYRQIVEGYNWNNYVSYDSPIPQKSVAKKYRAYLLIACSGAYGTTENHVLFNCSLSSGRNYASQLERELKITLHRYKDSNCDGIGAHFRYALTSKEDAEKVLNLINKNNPKLLLDYQIANILELYPKKAA